MLAVIGMEEIVVLQNARKMLTKKIGGNIGHTANALRFLKKILNTIFIPVMLKELSLSLADTANRADSGQLQFWSGPSEILNLRS